MSNNHSFNVQTFLKFEPIQKKDPASGPPADPASGPSQRTQPADPASGAGETSDDAGYLSDTDRPSAANLVLEGGLHRRHPRRPDVYWLTIVGDLQLAFESAVRIPKFTGIVPCEACR